MLLNNFKPLLYFGSGGTFTDVSGDTVNLSDFICSSAGNGANGHDISGVARSFNYNATPSTNDFSDEQTSYSWQNVTDDYGESVNGFVLFVGSGTTSVTASDYCLDNPVTLDVTGASCTCSPSGIVTTTRTFENNTGASVSINEYGLYVFSTQNGGYEKPVVMIGRKVFSSPIVIPNGEQRTFEYIIHMENVTFSDN